MTKRMVIMVVGVLVLVGAIAAAKALAIMKLIKESQQPQPPAVVTAMKAEMQEWQPQLTGVGSLRAVRGVDVTTEIAGLVRSLHFKSGDDVGVGTLLVQLNADADRAQLDVLKAAADLARTTLARDRAQLAVEAISQAQVDTDIADLNGKEAQVAGQQAIIDKKNIRAPFAGRLGITVVNPGQYLNAGDKIVTLQTIDPIYIDFYLPQQQIGEAAIGQKVTVLSDTYAGQTFTGKITAIDPKVDTSTRNVQVEATIKNDKKLLLPGMFGRAAVDSGAKQRNLTLPQTAITYNPYGATVFVAVPPTREEDKARRDDQGKPLLQAQQVFVTTGATRGDQVAIVKGLDEGALVVTSGQMKLKNGVLLRVDNAHAPANDANPAPQEH
ncbi:MAG TPA: efflux RND transporter periplasmic adaptor subunit [Rhodocyclaceae bacterium]|nr:efflux RND transporter periplasmic adaptor subunit [Rhodocyclaceae bacterium]